MNNLYRYSDGNTHTDNLTLEEAQKFQRLQNGGTVAPMVDDETEEDLLARVVDLQTQFWDALSDLESELGIDIDSTRDLSGLTVEDLQDEEED